jgi:hypothetical protein
LTWTPLSHNALASIERSDAGTALYTYQSPFPTISGQRQFFRLRVSQP